MRHQRLTVSAVVTLIVALMTTGAALVTAHPHDGSRRRTPARSLRGWVQRPDASDAISHEAEHHHPIASPLTEEVAAPRATVEARPAVDGPDPASDIHAFPPGLVNRVFSSAGDAHLGAAYPTVHFVPLRLPSSRQVLGRAPPAL
jgi:hypothetical protein